MNQESNIQEDFQLPDGDYYDGRCGEIFITHEKTLIFMCSICDCKYAMFDDFLEHLSSKHYLAEEDNIDLKEEVDDIEYFSRFEEYNYIQDARTNTEKTMELEISVERIKSFEDESYFIPTEENNQLINEQLYNAKNIYLTDTEVICTEDKMGRKVLIDDEKYLKPLSKMDEKIMDIDVDFEDECENVDSPLGSVLKCQTCNKTFETKKKLDNHVKCHTKERKYKCEECGFAFSEMFNLRAHIRRHKGIKPHHCKYCNKKFSSRNELQTHYRTHTGERPYVCETCGNRFATSGSLNEHRKRHNNYRPHKCECGKSFFDSHLLKEHKVIHSNERSHICPHCQASFKRRKSMIVHMKLHSEVKEYICEICNKDFAQKPGLVAHRKIHKIPELLPKIIPT